MKADPTPKKRKAGRLIFRIFLMLLISLVLGGSIYMLNAKTLMHNAMPMPFGVGASVVLSGSMEPSLSVDDLVFVKAEDSYDVGDVVVYQSGRSLVIHRILQIEGDAVVTKGDANNIEDAPIALADIKGRMVGVVPGAGRVVHFIQSPVGVILLLALSVFLLNRSWSKEKASDEKDLDALKAEIIRLKELEEQRLQAEEEKQAVPEQTEQAAAGEAPAAPGKTEPRDEE